MKRGSLLLRKKQNSIKKKKKKKKKKQSKRKLATASKLENVRLYNRELVENGIVSFCVVCMCVLV